MTNDKTPRESPIPPPLDPFPTYQTPYTRPERDSDNPFIQFRRAADDAFSSFFQGIPHLFGAHFNDTHWKQNVDETMRRRHELEEGWRKQFEQEMEEMRQELERSRVATSKALQDAFAPIRDQTPTLESMHQRHEVEESQRTRSSSHEVAKPRPDAAKAVEDTFAMNSERSPSPWWTIGNNAKHPASSNTTPQDNAKRCPALYDDAGQPKTELDLYNNLSPTPTHDPKPRQTWSQWFVPGDVKSREAAMQNDDKSSHDVVTTSQPTRYSMFGVRRLDPFDNPDHTIPWLMLSPYSPIYLCNPTQPRMFRVRIQDSENTPLQISRPRFFDRWYSDVDEKLANQLPWADAFEDLISVQQTGEMVDRNYSTLRTPPTWIHDMVARGSLGDRWGFDANGFLVKKLAGSRSLATTESSKNGCAWKREAKGAPSCHNEKTSAVENNSSEDTSIDKFVDDVTEPLAHSPIFGGLLATADAIVDAVERGIEDSKHNHDEAQTESFTEPEEETETDISREQEETGFPPYHSSSSSSSYESYFASSSSSEVPDSKSIISTLTSTVTRTLPDGSIETKRVLKKRFADGSEETDESTERQNAQRKSVAKQTQTSSYRNQQATAQANQSSGQDDSAKGTVQKAIEQARSTKEQHHQVSEKVNEAPTGNRRGGGWFWTK
ncbi:hypothetical protein PV10_04326 [Exophiala mesophila]|uniref:Uncharacterized protein n=1 Tax=Exophiala mesophila TaxID=212818 RepID=A0A0D1ZEG3_EXOME|nr:uncharacterized protein PV10_04326 [Exophiala mesophila]KIV93082.1 hypothetical protein PV10_04326 [Exophiala mesophila]